MHLNQTSVWKVMTFWNSRELPLFNFERFNIPCPRIVHPCENVMTILKFSRASVVQFRASRYIMSPNRTSVWKVMTIWISRELPLFNFERLDILCAWIGYPCEMLWPFKFLDSFGCSISSVSIYYVPESSIRAKSYDHLNFSTAFVVQLWVSQYIMSSNCTSMWKLLLFEFLKELPLFKFERLDILCAWIRHSSEMLWLFEFRESFRYSILSV